MAQRSGGEAPKAISRPAVVHKKRQDWSGKIILAAIGLHYNGRRSLIGGKGWKNR
jgi:hypothetical protein